MRFFCLVAYLIGFRRILLLVLVLMAIAIAQHHKRCVAAVSPPMRPTAAAPRWEGAPSARDGGGWGGRPPEDTTSDAVRAFRGHTSPELVATEGVEPCAACEGGAPDRP